MIEIEQNCYLACFDKKDQYAIGETIEGKTIISIELYYLDDGEELKKYIRIKTLPINFSI